MNSLETAARLMITLGIILLISGVLLYAAGKFGLRLPGDILIKRENSVFYFPIVTCIVISLILTIILNIFGRR